MALFTAEQIAAIRAEMRTWGGPIRPALAEPCQYYDPTWGYGPIQSLAAVASGQNPLRDRYKHDPELARLLAQERTDAAIPNPHLKAEREDLRSGLIESVNFQLEVVEPHGREVAWCADLALLIRAGALESDLRFLEALSGNAPLASIYAQEIILPALALN